MAKDVSIIFKASDNLTNSIKSMRKSVDGLSRDVSEYRKIQSQAFDKKTEVKFEITKAKQELKELEKAVRNNVDGSQKAFKEKARTLEDLQEEYKRLSQAANEASKAERQLTKDMHESRNYTKTMGESTSLMKGLATAGLGSMFSSAIGNSLNQSISSAFGSTAGDAISTMASSTLAGASMGSIAGPIGMAVGAAVGGLTGAINALVDNQQKNDDLFREEIQGLFELVKQEQSVGLANGIELSSTREQNIMGLGTLLSDREKGIQMFEEIKQFGVSTPYEASAMLDSARQMLAYGIKEENIMSDIKMLGEVAMGDQNKFNSLSYAYAQTQSAGKLTGQDLMQYTSAGFNPLQVLADEQGRTLAQMREDMSDGLISSDDVTRAFQIATQEGGKFFGAMNAQMDTYKGKLSMLNDINAEIEAGYGEGYNATRQKGMEQEIEALNGELGDKMKEANRLIGEFQADLENKQQQLIIEAMSNAMESEDYMMAKREDDGAEMGRIIAAARAQAEIDYKNTDGYRLQQETDLRIVSSLQEDVSINSGYLEYGRKMGEQFSKGYALTANSTTSNVLRSILQPESTRIKTSSNSHATGLDRVPYNGYQAILHEGERVVTKVDANKQDYAKEGISIGKLADSIVIREEADIQKVVSQLYSELKKYAINAS